MDHKNLIAGTATLGKLNSKSSILSMLRRISRENIQILDTAPLYGAGCMERILGEHLKEFPNLHVNTKFGLDVPNRQNFMDRLYLPSKIFQSLTRKLLRSSAPQIEPQNIVAMARQSLIRSSFLLQNRIDVFFAHEVPISIMDRPDFISFVQQTRKQGLFRRFGLGGYRQQYESTISSSLWNEIDVLQVESKYGQPVIVPDSWKGDIFLHGVIASQDRTALHRNPDFISDLISDAFVNQGAKKLVVGFSKEKSLENFLSYLR